MVKHVDKTHPTGSGCTHHVRAVHLVLLKLSAVLGDFRVMMSNSTGPWGQQEAEVFPSVSTDPSPVWHPLLGGQHPPFPPWGRLAQHYVEWRRWAGPAAESFTPKLFLSSHSVDKMI